MKDNKDKDDNGSILPKFGIDTQKSILDIINDCPSLVQLGDKQYKVKNMRYYSLYRICKLALKMKEGDSTLDDDNKILTALCTDLDSMCEIMAIVLCNHLFKPGRDADERNDRLIREMKMVVMNSTYDTNQWAAIILGAIQSIDLGGFFLLRKSVSTLTDSLMTRKKKSEETVSQFMEARSLLTPATS